jgi:RNA polymerase sigma factor (sigma-70 family)
MSKEHDKNEFETILLRARKLDKSALAMIFERYYGKIVKFMYYRSNANDAEDMAATVFLKVMRSIQTQKGNFDAWIYKIARNVIIDNSRHNNAKPEAELSEPMQNMIKSSSSSIETVANQMDLTKSLSMLNEDQQEILTLKFIQGLSNESICEITGKTPGAVRAMQFRALETLKSIMRKEGE